MRFNTNPLAKPTPLAMLPLKPLLKAREKPPARHWLWVDLHATKTCYDMAVVSSRPQNRGLMRGIFLLIDASACFHRSRLIFYRLPSFGNRPSDWLRLRCGGRCNETINIGRKWSLYGGDKSGCGSLLEVVNASEMHPLWKTARAAATNCIWLVFRKMTDARGWHRNQPWSDKPWSRVR